jgi:hypothetical protein
MGMRWRRFWHTCESLGEAMALALVNVSIRTVFGAILGNGVGVVIGTVVGAVRFLSRGGAPDLESAALAGGVATIPYGLLVGAIAGAVYSASVITASAAAAIHREQWGRGEG